jgi:peptidyl-prolyl cis-trans isomerase SurA
MTLSLPLRAVITTSLALSAVFVQAQAPKPVVNQGPYQPQAQASPFNGKVVEDVVARVNDQIITSSDYQRALQQMDADGRQQNWSEQELADRKKDLLRDLIDKELLLSKGKELGITGETELIKRLDDIRKQNHLESMEDLEKAAQSQGVSYEDFKQNIRNEIISQEVIRDQVSRRIQLTKADVTNYYQNHKAEFEQPETVRLSEILIPVKPDDAASLEQAQAKAADVEAKLKSGISFDELAKQDSSGPTAQTGGDLGEFKKGSGLLAKPFEDATFSLKTGEVTAPIRTKQGLIIFKVVQHTGGSNDYASVEPQVEEAAFMDRMQPQLRTYLTTLREQAYIDVRPGFHDAGAAAHSVKPLYSAYTQPGAKKKKKVQKARFRQASTRSFRSKSGTTTSAGNSKQASAATPATDQAAGTPTPAATEAAGNTTAATTTAPAATSSASKQVASNGLSTKPVKKQKVRFGQAPSQSLAATAGSSTATTNAPVSEPANTASETQVASNASSSGDIAGSEPTAAPKTKTRFAYRAHEPKQKKAPTQDQLENKAVADVTPEQQAAEAQQTAPLGLAGDTAKKKKEPKPKLDHKTRYAETPKTNSDAQPAATPDTTPTSAAGPLSNLAPTKPKDDGPSDTPPAGAGPASSPTPPTSATPPTGTAPQPAPQ